MRYFKSSKIQSIFFLSILFGGLILYTILRQTTPIISHTQANTLFDNNKIEKIVLEEPYLRLVTIEGDFKVYQEAINKSAFFTKYTVEVEETSKAILFPLYLIAIALGGILYLHFRTNLPKHESKNEQHKEVAHSSLFPTLEPVRLLSSDIKFSDVSGISDVKEELEEIIDFLKDPLKYKNFDIRLPKGVLLVGPPGVGKTMISKAVAKEAGVPFFYQSGASFVHIYVGMGAKRVNELFARAKQMAPSIIFIDEIDAVGKSRSGLQNDEREATLNQLLTEMDGFEESFGVIVIAATNKIEVLDEALLRPGRFDRRIHISLPDIEERIKTLAYYLKHKPNRVDLQKVGRMTIGFSSAALSTLVNEAAIHAMRKKRLMVITDDFESVKDKVLLGKRRVVILTPKEREIQAVYQSAKAVVATWLDVYFEKIGLIQTTLSAQESEVRSKSQIFNTIKVYLAGTIASRIHFDEQYINGGADITEAKALLHKALFVYLLHDDFTPVAKDEQSLLRSHIEETKMLITLLKPAIDKVTEYLLEYENIDQEKCREVLREIF